MIHYEQITHGSSAYKEACDLRYRILRKPIGMILREKDVLGEDEQLHFAGRDTKTGKLIATVIFKPISETHIKLRQMAVEDGLQGQGIGAGIVRFAEQSVAAKGFRTVETSARKTAIGFYEKLGYAIEGDPYEEVGLHTIKMVKSL